MTASMTIRLLLCENDAVGTPLRVSNEGTCMQCFDNINLTSEMSRPHMLVLQDSAFSDVGASHLYALPLGNGVLRRR